MGGIEMKDWIKKHMDIDTLVDSHYYLYELGDKCTACFLEDSHKKEEVRTKAIEIFMRTNKVYLELDNKKVKI